ARRRLRILVLVPPTRSRRHRSLERTTPTKVRRRLPVDNGFGQMSEQSSQPMFDETQNSLLDRRTMMRRTVRMENGFTVLEIPIVALHEHFVVGIARLPTKFLLRL